MISLAETSCSPITFRAVSRFNHLKLRLEHPPVFLIQVPVRSCRLVVLARVLVLGGQGSLGLVITMGLVLGLDAALVVGRVDRSLTLGLITSRGLTIDRRLALRLVVPLAVRRVDGSLVLGWLITSVVLILDRRLAMRLVIPLAVRGVLRALALRLLTSGGLTINRGFALRLVIPLNPNLHFTTRLILRRLGVGHSLLGASLVKDIQVVSLAGDLLCRDRVELAGGSLGVSGEAKEEALAGGVSGAELLAGLGGGGSWRGKGLDFGGGSGGGGDVALLGAGVEGMGEDGGGH
jgi:hypothetical protein